MPLCMFCHPEGEISAPQEQGVLSKTTELKEALRDVLSLKSWLVEISKKLSIAVGETDELALRLQSFLHEEEGK